MIYQLSNIIIEEPILELNLFRLLNIVCNEDLFKLRQRLVMLFQQNALLFHHRLIDTLRLASRLNRENDISAQVSKASHEDVAAHCATKLSCIAEPNPNTLSAKCPLRPLESRV